MREWFAKGFAALPFGLGTAIRSRRKVGGSVRVVVAQGPQQLLVATAALRHLRAVEGAVRARDIVLIGSFYSARGPSARMRAACREVAAAAGYAEVIDAEDLEAALRADKASFDRLAARLRERFAADTVDTIFLTRNGQALNELALAAAGDEARRICYGDGMGLVALDRSYGEPVYNPRGYLPISEAWLTSPAEAEPGRFDRFNVVTVPAGSYPQLLQELCRDIPALRALKASLLATTKSAPITLATTGTLTESQHTADVAAESDLFFTSGAPFIRGGEMLLIKPHPRATRGQAELLAARFAGLGARTLVHGAGDEWPVEMLGTILGIERVLGFGSSSSIMLAYQCRCPVQLGYDREAMQRLVRPPSILRLTRSFKLIKRQVRQAFTGRFSPIRDHDLDADPPGFDEGSELLTPESAGCVESGK